MIYIADQVLVWISWIFLLVFREIPRKLHRPPSVHALPPILPSPQAPSQPLEPLPTEQEDSTDTDRRETFYITNVHTGAYAALLDDNDRSELVGVTLNLMERPHRGAEVNICGTFWKIRIQVLIPQWWITHMARDQYTIQNANFTSFAGYDSRPTVDSTILGKWQVVSVWQIRSTPTPGVYT